MNKIRRNILMTALDLLDGALTRVEDVLETETALAEEGPQEGARAEAWEAQNEALDECKEAITSAIDALNQAMDDV